MTSDQKIITSGFFLLLILYLSFFLIYRNPLDLFNCLAYMIIIIAFIFPRKHHYKTYYFVFLSIIITQGLLLAYIFLFSPYAGGFWFYGYLGFFILFIIIFVYQYSQRQKYISRNNMEED